jgi:hypothetical protein
LDALLGGGDVTSDARTSISPSDRDRYTAFRGAGAVVEMAAQLSTAALDLLDKDLLFATAATIRQLLETEYLVTAFASDLSKAEDWARATPDEVRRSFQPGQMRSIGGFRKEEYWQHCTMGGHPSPQGAVLLQYSGPALANASLVKASVWGDLAQHLRRLWSNVNDLPVKHHARYAAVRATEIKKVIEVEDAWTRADPLAEPVSWGLLNKLTSTDGAG